MPKREDIKSVLVIGSGPIVIGQACEFDYSGTQACRVLMADRRGLTGFSANDLLGVEPVGLPQPEVA